MMTKRVLVVIGVALLVTLSGCSAFNDTGDVKKSESLTISKDTESEVVCFSAAVGYEAGIDCMPVEETSYSSIEEVPTDKQLIRIVEDEANVVCYKVSSGAASDISCLKKSETAL